MSRSYGTQNIATIFRKPQNLNFEELNALHLNVISLQSISVQYTHLSLHLGLPADLLPFA